MEANFFEPGSPFLKHPLLTPERTAAEIDFILSVLPLEAGDRILDIGCGFGRHSHELARRGFDVLGIKTVSIQKNSICYLFYDYNCRDFFRYCVESEIISKTVTAFIIFENI